MRIRRVLLVLTVLVLRRRRAVVTTTTKAPSKARVVARRPAPPWTTRASGTSKRGVCSEGEGGGETAERAQGDEAETQGVTEEAINIGTVADPGFEGRQGLNQEIFDSSEAFVEWCNSHGGSTVARST